MLTFTLSNNDNVQGVDLWLAPFLHSLKKLGGEGFLASYTPTPLQIFMGGRFITSHFTTPLLTLRG